MSEEQFLDQAQIWDDSALQAIWNASVKEYQKYHSINARGEDVAEVLRRAAEAESGGDDADVDVVADAYIMEGDLAQQSGSEDGEIPDGSEGMTEDAPNSRPITHPQVEEKPATAAGNGTAKMGPEQSNGMPSIPQAMIAQSTHDEKLKSLMMSWYWAGYYTGLYEGQQQGHNNAATNGT